MLGGPLDRWHFREHAPGVAQHFPCLVVRRNTILVDDQVTNVENPSGLFNPGPAHTHADGGILDKIPVGADFVDAGSALQVLLQRTRTQDNARPVEAIEVRL